jgi:carboxymethylenebutenolidase
MRSLLVLPLALLLLGCSPPSGKAPAVEESEPRVETVTYPSGKESVHGFLCRPGWEGSFPGLMVIHDDFGLTDWVKERARHLADRGYVVLAIDLYRGEAVSNLEDAHIMDRGLPEDRVYRDLKAAVDYLKGRKDVRGQLGVVGFGMGGGYALDAAIRDSRLHAVVTCYGRLTTDAKLLAPLNASVFAVFAGKDQGIPPETIEQFRVAMNKADKRVAGLRVYGECGHGFLDPANWPTYGKPKPEDVENVWELIGHYLYDELKR